MLARSLRFCPPIGRKKVASTKAWWSKVWFTIWGILLLWKTKKFDFKMFFFPFMISKTVFLCVLAELQVFQILVWKELFEDKGECTSGKQSWSWEFWFFGSLFCENKSLTLWKKVLPWEASTRVLAQQWSSLSRRELSRFSQRLIQGMGRDDSC